MWWVEFYVDEGEATETAKQEEIQREWEGEEECLRATIATEEWSQ